MACEVGAKMDLGGSSGVTGRVAENEKREAQILLNSVILEGVPR